MKEGYRFLGSLPTSSIERYREYCPKETFLHFIIKYRRLCLDLLSELNREVFYMVRKEFGSPFIIHSMSFLNNTEQNFSHQIHRDIRFFSGKIPLMFNMLIMLDDFTEENGATWFVPGSHKFADKATEDEFDAWGVQATGKAGDILFWNSNLWHKAGVNKTGKPRRAIAITLSKSCLKQLLDYPRALDEIDCPEEIKQLLGYHSIVPASLEEWNGERTYKKDQD